MQEPPADGDLWDGSKHQVFSQILDDFAHRSFATLDELEEATIHRCQVLLERRELIRGLTNFSWWEVAVS